MLKYIFYDPELWNQEDGRHGVAQATQFGFISIHVVFYWKSCLRKLKDKIFERQNESRNKVFGRGTVR